MKKFTYADYMSGEIKIKKEDEQIVLKHFKEQNEMKIDEYGRIYNEGGQYIADIEE